MNLGHGVTGLTLERACEEGAFRAPGKRVLLKAIWAEQAHRATAELTLDKDGRNRLNVMDAVAFEVRDIGPEVPAEWGLRKGDVAINVSISGEKVNAHNQSSPWVVVHYEDIVGIVPRESVIKD